jgi:hypothetical protein
VKHRLQVVSLRLAIAALAPGAGAFWRFAAASSYLKTKLDNLKAGDE